MDTSVADPFGLVGRSLEGRYRVEAAVAEGGFAVVYRARQETLSKAVALKVLKVPSKLSTEAREEAVRAFLAEARTLARLDHPAVARVIDFGVLNAADGPETPWMALDWIEGRTLAAWLRARPNRREGVPPGECLRLLRPVFDALARAHALGIVHRDIKPSNLMLADEPAVSAPVRLLDFGIAKITEPGAQPPSGGTRTETAAHAFSLGYAAPEQVTGTRTGPWTDVHGLALVICELLTGVAPYPGDDPMALYLQVLSSKRPTPERAGVDVGPWEPVLARALALLPAERFPDAGAFLTALEAQVPSAVRPADPRPEPSAPEAVRDVPPPAGALVPGQRTRRVWGTVITAGVVAAVLNFTGSPERPRGASPRSLDGTTLAFDGGATAARSGVSVTAPLSPPPDAHSPPDVLAPVAPRIVTRALRRSPSPAAPRDAAVALPAPASPPPSEPVVPEPAPAE